MYLQDVLGEMTSWPFLSTGMPLVSPWSFTVLTRQFRYTGTNMILLRYQYFLLFIVILFSHKWCLFLLFII